jgi:hypothetical protein
MNDGKCKENRKFHLKIGTKMEKNFMRDGKKAYKIVSGRQQKQSTCVTGRLTQPAENKKSDTIHCRIISLFLL